MSEDKVVPLNKRRRPRHTHSAEPTNHAFARAYIRLPIPPSAARSRRAKDWARPCQARPSALPENRRSRFCAGKAPAKEHRGFSCALPISAGSTTNSGCAPLRSKPRDPAPWAFPPRLAQFLSGSDEPDHVRAERRAGDRPAASDRRASKGRAENSASTACSINRFAPDERGIGGVPAHVSENSADLTTSDYQRNPRA